MKADRILAIDPGTRETGVAVLEAGDLVYYGVKTVRVRRTLEDVCRGVKAVVHDLIGEYEPSVLALKQPLIIQQSAAPLAVIVGEIKQVARDEGLFSVCEYAPKTVRQFVCGRGKVTKREAARQIAYRFTELARYVDRRSRWDELYYSKLFDAVAVGLTCYYDEATSKRSTQV